MKRARPPKPETPGAPSGGPVPGRGWGIACLTFLLVLVFAAGGAGCRKRADRLREQSRLDSLMRDSSRRPDNPYKLGQGNDQYNRERENLGNLDSLVRPGATTPRP